MLFAAEGGRAMLVELGVMEQRYHAVMEVVSGAPVAEVARRYGVSRQAVHGWLGRYEREGLTGLADHSHLWVPKTYATWADALGIAVGSVKRLGVGRAGLGSAGGGMIFGLWA
jgi:hypothetical protein